MDRASIIKELKTTNIEFKRMCEKHREYELELAELQKHIHLSTNEEMRAKNIKKNKLKLKDKMEKLITGYKRN